MTSLDGRSRRLTQAASHFSSPLSSLWPLQIYVLRSLLREAEEKAYAGRKGTGGDTRFCGNACELGLIQHFADEHSPAASVAAGFTSADHGGTRQTEKMSLQSNGSFSSADEEEEEQEGDGDVTGDLPMIGFHALRPQSRRGAHAKLRAVSGAAVVDVGPAPLLGAVSEKHHANKA